MEMAYEVYGADDKTVSYTITNTGMDPVTFDSGFSLEYNDNDIWKAVPFAAQQDTSETYTLPGLQMCAVEIDMGMFGPGLPEGGYRIVRTIGDVLSKAEFAISDQRIDALDMSFGFVPLDSLPPDYDAADAQNDGCYTLMEDGPKNQDAVSRFADKASFGVPAKLRTMMLGDGGGAVIRDIVFAPLPDGTSRFLVTTDGSRAPASPGITEATYSYLSLAKVGNKSKACLSDYMSYSDQAPDGAPLELLSPGTPDNIDLVATIQARTETALAAAADDAGNPDSQSK